MGRRQYAHIDLNRFGAAHGANLVLLQDAQQLYLQAHRHVADFVEQQGAAIGGLEQAFVIARGAGERTFHVTKQFRLEQVLGHGAAIDRDKCLVLARTRTMNGSRQQFLAGAALAGDQYARIGHGNHLRLREGFLQFLVACDDLGGPVVVDFGRA